MAAGHCDAEVGLNFDDMESFKRKLRPPNNAFLSSVKEEDEYIAYDTFFRALEHDIESRRGMFPVDFVKISKRIIDGPDSTFIEWDNATGGIIYQSLPSIAQSLLPKWFAQKVQEIIIKDSSKKAIV